MVQKSQGEREQLRERQLEVDRELKVILDSVRHIAASFRDQPDQISLYMDQLQSEGNLTPLMRQQLGVEFTSLMGGKWADRATGITPQGKSVQDLGAAIMADAQASMASMPAPLQTPLNAIGQSDLARTSWYDARSDAMHQHRPTASTFGHQSVQMKSLSDQEQDKDAIHEEAEKGVKGSGSALPHAERIQEAFGDHDISGTEAHVGGQAAKASEAIGASAYASGNKIAFKESPDLHTAAHEAAHIIQQRAGVSLEGGVGQTGDAYEQHADAVADAVVQGKSAKSLLDAAVTNSSLGKSLQAKGNVQKKADQNDTHPDDLALERSLEMKRAKEMGFWFTTDRADTGRVIWKLNDVPNKKTSPFPVGSEWVAKDLALALRRMLGKSIGDPSYKKAAFIGGQFIKWALDTYGPPPERALRNGTATLMPTKGRPGKALEPIAALAKVYTIATAAVLTAPALAGEFPAWIQLATRGVALFGIKEPELGPNQKRWFKSRLVQDRHYFHLFMNQHHPDASFEARVAIHTALVQAYP